MKKPENEYVITEKRPQVLFLGNGICRAFGGISWNGLLDKLKDETLYPDSANKYLLPMPLKAAMLTDNRLATKMRNVVKAHDKQNPKVDGYDWSSFVKVTPEMKVHILSLIGKRFDYVLTTNYSYEIEAAIVGQDTLSASQIAKMMHFHEVDHAQTRFLANTFNEVNDIPIWHVHGEARKPDSMIIGSYYYGKLLRRCVERLESSLDTDEEGKKRKSNSTKTAFFKASVKHNKPIKIGSWIDAFVLGDVYILGFGLDFSEADIWWLLEYKANHRDICGSTFFYEPRKDFSNTCINDDKIPCLERSRFIDGDQCKKYLLKNTYGVVTKDLGITASKNEDYVRFNQQAVKYISQFVDKRFQQ